MENVRRMKEALQHAGFGVTGGENAPYLWVKTPEGVTSWEFFDRMLHRANVVVTPGAGFGAEGEGFVRLTAFGKREDCVKAMKRIRERM